MIQKADIDSTIEDIHRTRERLAEKFGGDINAILDDARRRQSASDRPTWQGPLAQQAVHPSGSGDISDNAESIPVAR